MVSEKHSSRIPFRQTQTYMDVLWYNPSDAYARIFRDTSSRRLAISSYCARYVGYSAESKQLIPVPSQCWKIIYKMLGLRHIALALGRSSVITLMAEKKWPLFSRWQFAMYFLVWKCIKFQDLTQLGSWRSNYNFAALVQIMAWRRPGDKPLSESMMVGLPTHIYVTGPQWNKFSVTRI